MLSKPCDGWTDLVEFLCVGEYPMTGAQAAEKEVPGSRADILHRGRNVTLAFTMQVSPSCCRFSSNGLWQQQSQLSLLTSCASSYFGPTNKYCALIDPFSYKDAKFRLLWAQASIKLYIIFVWSCCCCCCWQRGALIGWCQLVNFWLLMLGWLALEFASEMPHHDKLQALHSCCYYGGLLS